MLDVFFKKTLFISKISKIERKRINIILLTLEYLIAAVHACSIFIKVSCQDDALPHHQNKEERTE